MSKHKRVYSSAAISKSSGHFNKPLTEPSKMYGAFAEEVKEINSFVKYTPSPTPVEGKGIGVKSEKGKL